MAGKRKTIIKPDSNWNLTPKEAIALQKRLAQKVITHDHLNTVHTVAGVDVGFENNGQITRAAVAVLKFPELELIDHATIRMPTIFPYIPGLLSFREVPAILEALKQLIVRPNLILCDGQGIAHPRRFGLACHLGVLTEIPTIGVAKTRLIGTHEDPGQERGDWTALIDKEACIGAVLRTRPNVKPLFISSGHRICLNTALDYVMRCTTRYRLPETTRWAHKLASGKREEIEEALAKTTYAQPD